MVIGVVGAGAMGAGIAQIAAQNGCSTILLDNSATQLAKAETSIKNGLNKLVEKGKLTSEMSDTIFGSLKFSCEYSDLSSCDFVVEAIVENLEIKKQVFSLLEETVSAECILATNTSSLSIASISSILLNQNRFLGVHFFNPATILPLVEIIPSLSTDSTIISKVRSLIDSWGKHTVIAKDTPGFIVNRVARPFYGEAMRIYEEGIADIATIDYAMRSLGGFRMGPFELTDFIGHDVNYVVTETVWTQLFYEPMFRPSLAQKRLYEAGMYGRKSGKGFYDYSEGSVKLEPNTDENLNKQIFERIFSMLVNAAYDAMMYSIASREDLESAMVKGLNYPKGLLQWADEFGIDKVYSIMCNLYDNYGDDRYRPNLLLKKAAKMVS